MLSYQPTLLGFAPEFSKSHKGELDLVLRWNKRVVTLLLVETLQARTTGFNQFNDMLRDAH